MGWGQLLEGLEAKGRCLHLTRDVWELVLKLWAGQRIRQGLACGL